MKKSDIEDVKWSLIAVENGKKIVEHPVPGEVVGDIVQILIGFGSGAMCSLTEEFAQEVRNLIGKPIDEKVISQLTGLSEEYLKQLLEGTIEPGKTDGIMALVNIVKSLSM
ncbi:hypothetical protein HZF24_18470 [Sedimentibacter hydroxybenzoicus DSM 7310]|uniref:Uncharacterized protein n=1 Tax=Sedimentibacter hydroxybenzoicus DSM 7310 TaxID=1123245 RepID=A0A974BNC2_SEDHY|nr:hypothetical protein [Sedimentibacter hydroxybenzoicus]NYB76136.1 hypothetical protein [Sedimentibacter hydroxybenzoicus DSM 7310]